MTSTKLWAIPSRAGTTSTDADAHREAAIECKVETISVLSHSAEIAPVFLLVSIMHRAETISRLPHPRWGLYYKLMSLFTISPRIRSKYLTGKLQDNSFLTLRFRQIFIFYCLFFRESLGRYWTPDKSSSPNKLIANWKLWEKLKPFLDITCSKLARLNSCTRQSPTHNLS